ncbi:class I SAM-dependent methyltransferase [Aurantibacter crassamenti]|uniref:class I SAM-dependent methyltransferase n=1 Tax=Aurantibacter crassamenti TaxID=1837375 RepID=UPI00193A85E8|nr:class I SAM-dependent methyltransferase [Aurantibacter crassamenti]MBM1106246.1 class I SAM-dependent methyltransferase [Aurantibacter crassamenti]
MEEFWEKSFKEKKEMWGFIPSKSAVLAKDYFVKKGINNILIPGIGYGRNAQVFTDNGINVNGIEISKTAISLARKHYGTGMVIHHGSVTNMPFDNKLYDGIFCHALIHLLEAEERVKLIQDCYNQLTDNGCMIFTAINKKASNFGKGKIISKDRFELHGGVKIFYYDEISIQAEFAAVSPIEVSDVHENQPMFLIKTQRKN